MILFFVIVFGLILGSFLNAVIYRLYSGESITLGRSHCPHCHHELGTIDLFPILSFAFLRGRCRYCGKPISWQYPVVEALTAILLALAYCQFGLTADFYWTLAFIAILIVVGVFDFKHYLILDKVIYPSIVLAIIRNIFLDLTSRQPIWSLSSATAGGVAAGVLIAAFFAAQYFISKGRWIGFGDVKLGLLLGLILGLQQGLIMLLIAYWLGAVIGLILVAAGRKKLGSQVPFGSFLSLSAIIIMLYGPTIIAWYYRLLGL